MDLMFIILGKRKEKLQGKKIEKVKIEKKYST